MTTLQESPQSYDWTFRRVVWATLVFISVIFSFWLLYRFNQVVFILFMAIVFGTVIRPVVTWLYQHGISRIAGIAIVYLSLFGLLAGFFVLLFPLIIEQGGTLAAAVPQYYHDIHAWLAAYPNVLVVRLSEFLPVVPSYLNPVQQSGQDVMASAGQVWGYIISASNFIFLAIVILALTFYWTLDGPRIIQMFLMLVSQDQRESIRELFSAMEARLSFYIIGQGVLCLIIGIMALIAYVLIGLPNALVLALVAGVLEAVPLVGPLLGAIPAALIALSMGPDKLAWVIVATLVIQQLENSLLVPRVMSKAVGVNPFVTLLALFAFGSFFGIAGALMAIPMAAIIQLVLNYFVFRPTTTEPEISEGRDLASRLRYETQELTQDLRKQTRLKKRGSDLRIKQIDQIMDEIETITTDLDLLLIQNENTLDAP
jgi:predicted PurR-regulated permease PerM